jgi:hypothetical protein
MMRVAANMLFAAGYLAGLGAVWIGLEMLVFGGADSGRSVLLVVLGFGIWSALASIPPAGVRR